MIRTFVFAFEDGENVKFMLDENHPQGRWSVSASVFAHYTVDHSETGSTLDMTQKCNCIFRENIHDANFQIESIIAEDNNLIFVDTDGDRYPFKFLDLLSDNV